MIFKPGKSKLIENRVRRDEGCGFSTYQRPQKDDFQVGRGTRTEKCRAKRGFKTVKTVWIGCLIDGDSSNEDGWL